MSAKKVVALVVSLVLIVAVAGVTIWVVINFDNVKAAMSGSELYTKEDVEKSYEDGYDKALSDKEEYDKLINSYRDTIATQNDLVSQLNSEVSSLGNSNKDYVTQIEKLTEQRTNLEEQITTLNTIKTNNESTITELNANIETLSKQVIALQTTNNENVLLIEQLRGQITNLQSLNTQLQATNELNLQTIIGLNNQITGLNLQINDLTSQLQNNASAVGVLNAKITELQKSISYYEQYIANLESGEQIVVTFEFGGSVYNIQIINKNSTVSVNAPTSTEYVIFNGWTVGGETIDLATYNFTTNTKVVADVTYKYTVDFSVDNANIEHKVVLKDSKVTPPTNPTKAGYVFDYWTLDGVTQVDLSIYEIKQNTTFYAKFTMLYTVRFEYEGNTISTQTIKKGFAAEPVETLSTLYKVFNGWKVGGVIVNIDTYKITADTVFTADITYKYDVKFMSDGNLIDTQIIAKNEHASVPTTPTKDKHEFLGWSKDGTNTINVGNYVVTESTTFTALFILNKFDVKFMVEGSEYDTQIIAKNEHASVPTTPTKDKYKFVGWSLDGANAVDVSNYTITENITFTALFVVDKFDVTFKNGNENVSSQKVDNGGYAEKPTFDSETFMGWTVDGTTIVDLASYKVTADTTFTAKFGSWTLLFDDATHTGSSAGDKKIDVAIKGLKKGDKIKFSTPSLTVNDGREFAGGGYNDWNGFTYVGSGGNFTANEAWHENLYDTYPMPGELFFSSDKPVETVVGRKDYYENNTMTITISCKTDGVLTIEWSDKADFYIQNITVWLVYVVR